MNSLYIHIPFCEKKCFYCSFVVSVGQEKNVDRYIDCLEKESFLYPGVTIDTVFFGGGTPSFLNERQLRRVFEIIRSRFKISVEAEISLEANPESIDGKKIECLLSCGVNRISLGVQTFHDDYLKYLGRNHNKARALDIVNVLKSGGVNMSLDLMYGFPQQSKNDLINDLDHLIKIYPDHVSLYTLTIEENSRFYIQHYGTKENDALAEYYLFINDYLKDNGYNQYEVSNFARDGRVCRHNMNYWSMGEYIGLGVGAHSFWKGSRFNNADRLMEYMKGMEAEGRARQEERALDAREIFMDALLFGLRMNEGVNMPALEERYQRRLNDEQEQRLATYIEQGFLLKDNGSLKATDQGRLVLDSICSGLL